MTTQIAGISPLARARLAGILYLLVNIPAPFTLLYLPSKLIVRGDAAATAANITSSEALFRFAIVGNFFNSIGNILLVVTLYHLLKSVNKNAARLMVIFVLASVPIAMLNELTQLGVLQLLNGADYLNVFRIDQLQALAYFLLRLHGQGLVIAQIFWGLWLFPLGYLVFKSEFLPKVLGILLIIGCFGYVIQSFAAILGYNLDIIFYTSWGELLFTLWLLIKGVNAGQWQQRALESA